MLKCNCTSFSRLSHEMVPINYFFVVSLMQFGSLLLKHFFWWRRPEWVWQDCSRQWPLTIWQKCLIHSNLLKSMKSIDFIFTIMEPRQAVTGLTFKAFVWERMFYDNTNKNIQLKLSSEKMDLLELNFKRPFSLIKGAVGNQVKMLKVLWVKQQIFYIRIIVLYII